ncbi:MAG: hypothetical protein IJ333_01905 [Clostridia bacterium]|nr:hypothetical protein [Clostridia bacterium]
MKKILIVLSILALCLTGCKKTEQPPTVPEGEVFDTSGEKTVLYHGKQTFPLSFTLDGQQQIQNGTYWYYELANAYEKTWEDSFYTYSTKDLELNGNRAYSKLGKKSCYATNGDWPLFLNPVHTEYAASNQEQVDQALLTLAQRQLVQNQVEGETARITDVWICDLDGDGNQETLFKACNCRKEKEDAEEATLSVGYCFLAYAKDDQCQVLYSSFYPEGDSPVEKLTPLVCDLEGDGKWSLLIYQKGDYESFTTLNFSGGNFTKNYEVLF